MLGLWNVHSPPSKARLTIPFVPRPPRSGLFSGLSLSLPRCRSRGRPLRLLVAVPHHRFPGCKKQPPAPALFFLAQLQAPVQSNNKEAHRRDDQLPALGSAFWQADPHTEEAGISSQLWPDRYGCRPRCHYCTRKPNVSLVIIRERWSVTVRCGSVEQAPDQWKIITINESASAPCPRPLFEIFGYGGERGI